MAGRWLAATRLFLRSGCPQVCVGCSDVAVSSAWPRRVAAATPTAHLHPFRLSDSQGPHREQGWPPVPALHGLRATPAPKRAPDRLNRGVHAALAWRSCLCLDREEPYPSRPRTSRPSRCRHDDDLHPRLQPGRKGGPQPTRKALIGLRL
jgi:hypothetical protein